MRKGSPTPPPNLCTKSFDAQWGKDRFFREGCPDRPTCHSRATSPHGGLKGSTWGIECTFVSSGASAVPSGRLVEKAKTKICVFFVQGIDKNCFFVYNTNVCRRSLVVKPQLPKLMLRVRFPSPAPKKKGTPRGCPFSLEYAPASPVCAVMACRDHASGIRANAGAHPHRRARQACLHAARCRIFAKGELPVAPSVDALFLWSMLRLLAFIPRMLFNKCLVKLHVCLFACCNGFL